MLAVERLLEIEDRFGSLVQRIVSLELDENWDNAPHHTHLENFPYHKHVSQHDNLLPSNETCLEEVMKVILADEHA